MKPNQKSKTNPRISDVPEGKIIHLNPKNKEDLQFVREAFGFAAEEKGWFRERDRIFVFKGALTVNSARSKLRGEAPPGILDVPMPPRPDGPLSQRFLTMDDGSVVRWIRHPSVLPKSSRHHWRNHTALFEHKGRRPDFVCYTSIPSFAVVDGADGKEPWTDLPPAWPHAFDLFLDAVSGKPYPALVSAREAALNSAVMEAFYQSARQQSWVEPVKVKS